MKKIRLVQVLFQRNQLPHVYRATDYRWEQLAGRLRLDVPKSIHPDQCRILEGVKGWRWVDGSKSEKQWHFASKR